MTKEELEMAMEEIKACTANAKDIRNITVRKMTEAEKQAAEERQNTFTKMMDVAFSLV